MRHQVEGAGAAVQRVVARLPDEEVVAGVAREHVVAPAAAELVAGGVAGDPVGELTLTGPLGTASTPLSLAGDLPDPDAWWRLSHPLELWGLID